MQGCPEMVALASEQILYFAVVAAPDTALSIIVMLTRYSQCLAGWFFNTHFGILG